jgi:Mn-dependent DtxR family transcriptional regulator
MKKDDDLLTASMEDYLEMSYRLTKDTGYTRTHDIANALNVQPPSTTKMMKKLSKAGFINYEKYGIITLSEKGKSMGKALLERHQIIEEFLLLLGISEGILEETEKIEHTISINTLNRLSDFVKFIQEKPGLIEEFNLKQKKEEQKD